MIKLICLAINKTGKNNNYKLNRILEYDSKYFYLNLCKFIHIKCHVSFKLAENTSTTKSENQSILKLERTFVNSLGFLVFSDIWCAFIRLTYNYT